MQSKTYIEFSSQTKNNSKMFRILLALFVICLVGIWAAPVEHSSSSTTHLPPVAILESQNEKHEDGSYNFSYHAEDGTHRHEEAVVRNAGTDNEYLEISGSYTYFDANGKEVTVTYKADDHGFVPEGGDILPQISVAAKQVSEIVPQPDLEYAKPPKV